MVSSGRASREPPVPLVSFSVWHKALGLSLQGPLSEADYLGMATCPWLLSLSLVLPVQREVEFIDQQRWAAVVESDKPCLRSVNPQALSNLGLWIGWDKEVLRLLVVFHFGSPLLNHKTSEFGPGSQANTHAFQSARHLPGC